MLVLTRRLGESIVIGADVVVTVLEVRGGQVRLGIEAPDTVVIHRSEVLAEDRQATAPTEGQPSLPSGPPRTD